MLSSLEAAAIPPPVPPPPPPPNENDDDNNNGKKPAPAAQPDLPPPPALRCPRCDSANTKFCYYNNYSLSQPRHFCKTCRRYWTKGGALRNVPIGGGCRKSKKSRSSVPRLPSFSAISPSVIDFSLSPFPQNLSILSSNLNRTCGPVNVGPSLPAGSAFLDSRFTHPFAASGFFGGGGSSVGATGGLVVPTAAATNGGGVDSSFLAASIESLSSLNQELHWKLQQQRLTSMLYNGGEGSSGGSVAAVSKPQSIFFQNLDVANPANSQYLHHHSAAGNDDQRTSMIGANQWLFDSSFGGSSGPTGGGSNEGDSNSTLNGGGVSRIWSHHIPPPCSTGPSGGGSNDGESGSSLNGGGVSGRWSHQIPPVCSAGWFEKGLK